MSLVHQEATTALGALTVNATLHGNTMQVETTSAEYTIKTSQNLNINSMVTDRDPAYMTTAESQISEFWELDVALLVQAYAGLLIVIVGVIGNSLCIATLSQKSSSTNTYLVNLAIADLTVCIIGQMCRVLPRGFTGIDPADFSPWYCKSWFFINHSAKTISAWTLVAVTVERTLVVYIPLKVKTMCTVSKARIVLMVINFFCTAIYLHYFWSYGPVFEIIDGKEIMSAGCTINAKSSELIWYMNNIRPMQDFIIRSAAPFICLLMCNTLIIGKLCKEIRRRTTMARGMETQGNNMASLTAMLLSVSFAFLICVSPMQIMYLIDKSDPFGTVIEHRWQAQMALRWAVAINLYYSNHAINFILYLVSGKHFRESLKKLFRDKCCLKAAKGNRDSFNSKNTVFGSGLQGSKLSLVSSPCKLVSYSMQPFYNPT